MGKVKQSLEECKAEILKELPEEFHGAFEAEMKKAADPVPLSPKQELEAIKAEAKMNLDCDHAALIPAIEKNPTAHHEEPPPSAAEQKAAIKAALAKVGELTAPPDVD